MALIQVSPFWGEEKNIELNVKPREQKMDFTWKVVQEEKNREMQPRGVF